MYVCEAVRCLMSLTELSAFVYSCVNLSVWLQVCVQYVCAVLHSPEHFGAFD